MSIVICHDCDHWIDSDSDPECFVGAYEPQTFKCEGSPDRTICEFCRDAYYDAQDTERVQESAP